MREKLMVGLAARPTLLFSGNGVKRRGEPNPHCKTCKTLDNDGMAKIKDSLKSSELFLNRELSWLEFNDRVLQEGFCEDVPLLERLKFLAIVSSNLDEFFLVRVAGLMRARAAKVRRRDPSGMTPAAQLSAISRGPIAWSSGRRLASAACSKKRPSTG